MIDALRYVGLSLIVVGCYVATGYIHRRQRSVTRLTHVTDRRWWSAYGIEHVDDPLLADVARGVVAFIDDEWPDARFPGPVPAMSSSLPTLPSRKVNIHCACGACHWIRNDTRLKLTVDARHLRDDARRLRADERAWRRHENYNPFG